MTFEFSTAQRIIFGNDSRLRLRELVKPLGQRVFLVGGSRLTNEGKVFDYLELIGGGRPLREPPLRLWLSLEDAVG